MSAITKDSLSGTLISFFILPSHSNSQTNRHSLRIQGSKSLAPILNRLTDTWQTIASKMTDWNGIRGVSARLGCIRTRGLEIGLGSVQRRSFRASFFWLDDHRGLHDHEQALALRWRGESLPYLFPRSFRMMYRGSYWSWAVDQRRAKQR